MNKCSQSTQGSFIDSFGTHFFKLKCLLNRNASFFFKILTLMFRKRSLFLKAKIKREKVMALSQEMIYQEL